MSTSKPIPQFFAQVNGGKTLAKANTIRNAILNLNSATSTYGITAAGTTQATATQLSSVLNQIDTAGSGTGVNLPLSTGTHNTPYQFCLIINNGSNAVTVYAFQGSLDTINGTAGLTGVSQSSGSSVLYASAKGGAWFAAGAGENANFGAITVTTINGLTITTSTGTLTVPNGVTVTGPATSGTVALINPPIQAGGATLAVTAAMSSKVVLLDTAAGTTATLPAATGSGNKYKFVVSVSTTSNAHKILAASSSDFIVGIAMGYTGSTAKVFGSPAATNHSIQMPNSGSQPSGGIIGDYFNFTDIGINLWHCDSMYQAGTTPTTPFSSATT